MLRIVFHIVVASLILMTEVSAAEPIDLSFDADRSRCGDAPKTGKESDYRARESSETLRTGYFLTMRRHYEPAERKIREGFLDQDVRDDLNFILLRWPNNIPALKALVEYDLAGGRPWRFPKTECYFEWAVRFAPDDPGPIGLGAYLFQRKGDRRRAELWYGRALELDPDSAELNYNIGLLYFDMGDYAKAVEHARVAYNAGYPLVGLRKKLIDQGYAP